MRVNTHLKPESQDVTGTGLYADGMVEHDAMVGQVLDKLDELGIADNTIVMYATDNGAEIMLWPGVIEPGTIVNEVGSHEDMLPLFLAAAGEPDIKVELLSGAKAIGRNYRVYLDGYNLMPALQGNEERPSKEFLLVVPGRRARIVFDHDQFVGGEAQFPCLRDKAPQNRVIQFRRPGENPHIGSVRPHDQ